MITVVTVSAWREDETISFDPHHPQTPDDVREKLIEMDGNDEVTLTFAYDEDHDIFVEDFELGASAY